MMACRLFGAKPLTKTMRWVIRNKRQWNFSKNAKLFIHENAFQNIVCEMTAILSRGDELKAFNKQVRNA